MMPPSLRRIRASLLALLGYGLATLSLVCVTYNALLQRRLLERRNELNIVHPLVLQLMRERRKHGDMPDLILKRRTQRNDRQLASHSSTGVASKKNKRIRSESSRSTNALMRLRKAVGKAQLFLTNSSNNNVEGPLFSRHPNVLRSPKDEAFYSQYQAGADPIIGLSDDLPPSRPVRVRALQFNEIKLNHFSFQARPTRHISDEMLNICIDGWRKSPYFDFVDATLVPDFTVDPDYAIQEDEDTVWAVDMQRMTRAKLTSNVPDQVVHLVNQTLHYHARRKASNPSYRKPSIRVVFMDSRDMIWERQPCGALSDLIDLLGEGNVRHVVQQATENRRWNETANFCDVGNIRDPTQFYECYGHHRTLHLPYTVRSDIVDGIQQRYQRYISPRLTLSTNPSPVDTVRPMDVAHFWSTTVQTRQRRFNQLDATTNVVMSLVNETIRGRRPVAIVARQVSQGDNVGGRSEVTTEYVEALLTTKIVVTAQQDDREDHSRLLEAVAGGAMVVSDSMLTLPDGLVHGESIVIFQSFQDLREMLLYYLQHDEERLSIARKGYEVAMGQHRSHHWMEKIFFGHQLSLQELVDNVTASD